MGALEQRVRGWRAPRSGSVAMERRVVGLPPAQHGLDDSPCRLDLVEADEEAPIACDHVEQQRRVRVEAIVRNLADGIDLERTRRHREARRAGLQLESDRILRLYRQKQPVRLRPL